MVLKTFVLKWRKPRPESGLTGVCVLRRGSTADSGYGQVDIVGGEVDIGGGGQVDIGGGEQAS